MIGDRIRDVYSQHMGITGREFVALVEIEGVSESALSHLRNRPQWQMGLAKLQALSDALLISTGWLTSDGEGEMWSPKWSQVRGELQKWARHDIPATPRERLVAVWEAGRELAEVREDIWAAYLRMAKFEKVQVRTGNYSIGLGEWYGIKQGSSPTQAHLMRASWLTGLPLQWFTDGDTERLVDDNEEKAIIEWVRENGLTLADLQQMMATTNPR